MSGPAAHRLPGDRLHLQHGPIDLIIGADGARAAAFAAAEDRFRTILEELVADLPVLRRPPPSPCPKYSLGPGAEPPSAGAASAAGRLMCAATEGFSEFITPMAAVAGSVAETILGAMVRAAPLSRAYVNNGGDIALHLMPGRSFRVALCGLDGAVHGTATIRSADRVRGIATSGRAGRSLTMGIADSVTVLATGAAQADAAATLIANRVDLPGHPAVSRWPATDIRPDSDLGNREVVVGVGDLTSTEAATALAAAAQRATAMRRAGKIVGAALFLRGQSLILGIDTAAERRIAHA